MSRAHQIIQEMLDTPRRVKVVFDAEDAWEAEFFGGPNVYKFNANADDGVWDVDFSLRGKGQPAYGNTGTGNELQVLSGVLSAFRKFVSDKQPQMITITSPDPARTRIFGHLIAKHAASLGYKQDGPVLRQHSGQQYVLVKA